MSFEDTLILRQSLADEFKVLQMMFSIPVNIPFVSFISINTPDGKTIKTVLKKATFHIKMPKWFILRSRIQEYFLALNNCVTQVKSITKKEKTLWKFPPNSLYTQAVGNEMDSFGMTPLLKTVAEANGVKKEEVYNWTWRNVNFEISMLAAGSRVQQAYNKLLEGKNKK